MGLGSSTKAVHSTDDSSTRLKKTKCIPTVTQSLICIPTASLHAAAHSFAAEYIMNPEELETKNERRIITQTAYQNGKRTRPRLLAHFLTGVEPALQHGENSRIHHRRASEAKVKGNLKNGAEGGTRTPTSLSPLDPEPSASANSATSAGWSLYLMCELNPCQAIERKQPVEYTCQCHFPHEREASPCVYL
jgi:hypothetical protein